MHGYTTRDLLEKHKTECKGLLKSPTRTEMPKAGENKMAFKNYYKQMKAPYVVYADFECVLRKINTCEPDNKQSFTLKKEKHEPCGFSYFVVRSDGQTFGPYTYKGEDAVYVFLAYLLNHEREMRQDMAMVMTNEDCTKICISTQWPFMILIQENTAAKVIEDATIRRQKINMRRKTLENRKMKSINGSETCLFCADPLLVPNFKDSVRDHDHMTGKYRGAAHNECNFKLKLNPKTAPIPVFFHNLKGYDGHLLMQAMARVQGEIKCIPTNTEKYISFSLGNLRFVDSVNFLLSSLDKLVKGSDEFPIMNRMMPKENKRRLLLKKGIYPYEYIDSFERFGETELPEKEKFYSYLQDAHDDYPLAPEKKAINPEQMSEYQRRLMADLDLTMPNTEKLVLTLEDKEKYVVHYSNLQFYLR